MEALKRFFKTGVFSSELDFRVRLFNIMAIFGMAISAYMAVGSVAIGNGPEHLILNSMAGICSAALLMYSYKTGNYYICYIISIVVIFMVFFPVMYFIGSGYESSMPYFFLFAMLFTAFMLRGRAAVILLVLELVLYSALFVIAYIYPETCAPYIRDYSSFFAMLSSFVIVGSILGAVMHIHFAAYERQRVELERARQEALRLSEVKSIFLANMSHEIRTPINVIIGMNEMVLRENDSEEVMGYAARIDSAGRTLLSLVNNILDVSRIESGKVEMVEEEYRLADLVNELVLIGQERANRRGLSFELNAGRLPSILYGDHIHLKQIIMNFISNAAKYTEQGGYTLSFEALEQGESSVRLRISVADTGIGIKEQDVERLFEAFARVDMPAHRDIQGSGLGLAIARELADLLGGSIAVESEWGVGSVFSLEVEQRVVEAALAPDRDAKAPSAKAVGSALIIAPEASVLVVDDNEANLHVVKSLLARTMMRVDTVLSGAECIRAVSEQRYDAILMDYRMPDMDGIQTMRELKTLPGFDTPVVALTANAASGAEQMFAAEGFAAYLSKPVIWSQLEQVLADVLGLAPESAREGGETDTTGVSLQQRQSLAVELLPYGVDMHRGLRFIGDDLKQYAKLGGYMLKDYEDTIGEVESLAAAEDWEGLMFHMHSLKSKARMAGATELGEAAAAMEKHCLQADGEYIQPAMPVLLLHWQRMAEGLAALMERTAELLPASKKQGGVDEAQLLEYIRAFHYRMARDMLEDAPQDKRLARVLEAVEALEFEQAEKLLLEGGEEDGKHIG